MHQSGDFRVGDFFVLLTIGLMLGLQPVEARRPLVAQTGNTISGYVFTPERRPLYDINVELMDEFSRYIGRTKTNASGRFIFSNLQAGRFRVRVLASGTEYQEQELDVEIQNFTRATPSGRTVTSGFENVQRDFYLRKKKGEPPVGRAESIFVQDVPAKAKELYDRSQNLLANKEQVEACKLLKSAIEIFPDYYDAIERLGTEYIKMQHYEAAQILLARAVEINPRGYPSWYGLAYALYSLNLADKAIKPVEKSIELNPNSIESLLLHGVALRKLKRYGESEKVLVKAKSVSKSVTPEIHWQLALLYAHNLERYQDAANELEDYLKAKPESTEAENIRKLIKQFREKANRKN
jgi:tetratricopeptide (TPR) repeat protein